jgi:hypothetical protein
MTQQSLRPGVDWKTMFHCTANVQGNHIYYNFIVPQMCRGTIFTTTTTEMIKSPKMFLVNITQIGAVHEKYYSKLTSTTKKKLFHKT